MGFNRYFTLDTMVAELRQHTHFYAKERTEASRPASKDTRWATARCVYEDILRRVSEEKLELVSLHRAPVGGRTPVEKRA